MPMDEEPLATDVRPRDAVAQGTIQATYPTMAKRKVAPANEQDCEGQSFFCCRFFFWCLNSCLDDGTRWS